MATIDSKEIIVNLLRNGGHYEDDPQCSSIWSYTNDWGKETNAVFWNSAYCDMNSSPFVRDPKLLWKRGHGLTVAGEDWLARYGDKDVRTL